MNRKNNIPGDMADNSVLIVGNLTLDENSYSDVVYKGPGGSVFFCSKILSNLNFKTTVISPYGPDFPKYNLPYTTFIPNDAVFDKTLAFRNTYFSGVRSQTVDNLKKFDWPDLDLGSYNILMLVPVLDNMNIKSFKDKISVPGVLKILLPQGFFRSVGKNNLIINKKWEPDITALKLFDFIILSEVDYKDIEKEALIWSKMGVTVILTRGELGCNVYQNGKISNFPGYKAKNVVDMTGAGDIFAASFAFAFHKSGQIRDSVEFANASAALSLPYRSNELEYTYSDIIEFARSQDRIIKL